ncbi:MAG: transposase [Acidobacteria bacterium]|nr:transposase [Acidobacteriota bacterium]MBI3657373.1 transposase [Acidobacteriota bacterium]
MKPYQKAKGNGRAIKAKDVHSTPIDEWQRLGVAADPLEELAREGARLMLIEALEDEIEEYLGRGPYERREEFRGHRNGYGRDRRVTIGSGTMTLRVPRVRAIPEGQAQFESQYLKSYQWRSQTVNQLFPELFIQGLATRDFEPALRCLLGQAAALSPATVSQLNAKFKGPMNFIHTNGGDAG